MFKFPSIYQFPPFFTKQIHLATASSQLQLWCNLVLEYCKFYGIWVLNMEGEAVSSSLESAPTGGIFKNTEINRELRPEYVKEVVLQLCKSGHLEMINSSQFLVYHKTLDEMAQMLLLYIEDTGQQNSILTIYELTQGEINAQQWFHGIDQRILLKVINILVQMKRAVLLKDGDQIQGVKIQ